MSNCRGAASCEELHPLGEKVHREDRFEFFKWPASEIGSSAFRLQYSECSTSPGAGPVRVMGLHRASPVVPERLLRFRCRSKYEQLLRMAPFANPPQAERKFSCALLFEAGGAKAPLATPPQAEREFPRALLRRRRRTTTDDDAMCYLYVRVLFTCRIVTERSSDCYLLTRREKIPKQP